MRGMTKRYPHITPNTDFPGVNSVNPYAQYPNTFDYSVFTPEVKLTLCRVPWDGERNIVGWNSASERNSWFDNLEATEHVALTTEIHVLPQGSIKLPVPFATLSRYNYLWVEYPEMPVDYAQESAVREWGFYIQAPTQVAASTTECHLRLDEWTTFFPYVKLPYMQLTRGHAPMAACDVDEYLANPMEHSAMLLAPDVTYGDAAGITRSHRFIPLAAGVKYVMFASLMSPNQIKAMGTTSAWSGTDTPPTYTDTTDRWGHQWQVNGYDWKLGDADMTRLSTPATPYSADTDDIMTAGFMYALPATEASELFTAIVNTSPQFMQTIQGCWIVPGDYINLNDSTKINLAGHEILHVTACNELPDIDVQLSKEQFGYPEEIANIAKLYTYPYACLNLSDNDGTSVDIRIENTGTLTVHRRVAIAYPYLHAQAFLTGANGTGAQTYEWRDLNDTVHTENSYDTEIRDFMLEYDIPTYGLYIDGYTDWQVHNQVSTLSKARETALNAYHTGQRTNNTGYENTIDAQKTTYENTYNSANVSYQNTADSVNNAQAMTNDSADTARTNSNLNANTARANASRSNLTGKTNTCNSAATAQTNANASAYAAEQNTFAANATAKENTDASADASVTNMENTKDANTKNLGYRTTTTTSNNFWQTWSGTQTTAASNSLGTQNLYADIAFMNTSFNVETATGAISTAGTAIGALASGDVGGAVSAVVGGAVSIAKDALINEATKTNNSTKQTNSSNFATDATELQNSTSEELTTNQNRLDTNLTESGNALIDANTRNSANTAKNNATRSKNTGDSNATRTYNTSTSNNQRTYDTTTGNAQNTYDTGEANAQASLEAALSTAQNSNEVAKRNSQRSRDTGLGNAERTLNATVSNAQASRKTAVNNALESRESSEYTLKTALEWAQTSAGYDYRQASNNAPVNYGGYSGNIAPDAFRYRGVQIRVKTQSESAIRQTASQFLRYGYKYEGAWSPNTLNVMPHYSYWECSETWLDCETCVMETVKNAIRTMFEHGVTVWRDASEIGRISIYDNL